MLVAESHPQVQTVLNRDSDECFLYMISDTDIFVIGVLDIYYNRS